MFRKQYRKYYRKLKCPTIILDNVKNTTLYYPCCRDPSHVCRGFLPKLGFRPFRPRTSLVPIFQGSMWYYLTSLVPYLFSSLKKPSHVCRGVLPNQGFDPFGPGHVINALFKLSCHYVQCKNNGHLYVDMSKIILLIST